MKFRDHLEAQRAHQQARGQERASKPLPQRLREALDRAQTLSATSAGSLEARISRGKAESDAPPAVSPFPLERYYRPVLFAVEELERALDAETGHASARNYALMAGFEKDRIILREFCGVHSREVARIAPELGSARTVERKRREAGLRPVDGTELPPEERKRAA